MLTSHFTGVLFEVVFPGVALLRVTLLASISLWSLLG